jgi:hypothetical protein
MLPSDGATRTTHQWLDTQYTIKQSCDRRVMQHTCVKHCGDLLLTLGACDSRAREYAQLYPGWRNPDANVFRRLKQRLKGDRKSYTSCRCQCRSSTECKDTSHWRCRKCCCVTRTFGKLLCYRKGIGTAPSIGLYRISWWWTNSFNELSSIYRRLCPSSTWFLGQQPDMTICNGAILLLHRFHSYN